MSAWIFALLLAVVPPGRHPRETYDVAVHRYASIADDVASVTTSRQTAALLVAIAVHESGLRADVDTGATLGDGGRARGLWQLQGVPSDLTRTEQAAVALARVQRSFRACGAGRHALAAYASGSCTRGLPESAAIMAMWEKIR